MSPLRPLSDARQEVDSGRVARGDNRNSQARRLMHLGSALAL